MKESLEAERQVTNDIEKKNRNLESRLETLRQVDKALRKCITCMDDCDVELKKKKEAEQKVKTIKDKIKETEHTLRHLQVNIQHLQRELQEAKKEQKELDAAQQMHVTKRDDTARARKELQERLDKQKQQHAEEIEQMKQLYNSVETHVRAYHEELLTALHS